MAPDATTTAPQEPDVPDVSLVDTPLNAPVATAEEQPAPPQQPTAPEGTPQPAPAADANATEATKEAPKDGQPAAQETPADGTQTEQPAAPEPSKEDRDRLARQAWLERQRTRQQVAQQIDQAYGPKTEEQLVEEGLSPEDAKLEAFRSEMAFKEQRAQIAELNANLRAEAVEVQKAFPIFDESSPEFDKDFSDMVAAQYQTAARLRFSEEGIVLSADVSLYDYYQQMYDIYSRGTSRGAKQGQTQMQEMLSRTENPGGSSSTQSGSPTLGTPESFKEFEEKYGNVVIT